MPWEDVDMDTGVVGDHGDRKFGPSAANGGAYAGLVHGIASRPEPKPKTPRTPATRGPPQPHPSNPQDAFTTPWGHSPPASIGKPRYAECVLALI